MDLSGVLFKLFYENNAQAVPHSLVAEFKNASNRHGENVQLTVRAQE